MKRYFVAMGVCAAMLATPAMFAQQPKVNNTQFTTEAVSGNLTGTMERLGHGKDRVWLGYEVPSLPGRHFSSCSAGMDPGESDDGCCGEFRLEDQNYTNNSGDRAPIATEVYVLYRFDHGQLVKIRPVIAGCHLNAGGVAFTWLTGVTQEESVRYLTQLATQSQSRSRIMDGALLAMSYHATQDATHALVQIASSDASMHTREQAAFWLGVMRGHEGFVALQSLAKQSTDTGLREKLPFDFSQNSDPAAEDELIAMAKSDGDTKVREQALFWLAQKAGKKAVPAITDVIQNDPETDVKKKAVFALSQLPKDESVPQLIRVADTNSNLAIRKEAFFWLGQSQDPRALAYLEQVLKK